MTRSQSKSRLAFPLGALLGALILPWAFAGSVVLARHALRFDFSNYTQLALLTGAGVYGVMHLLLWKPIFMHVMGHELTHAFWAFILGGKIKSFQVSTAGGQVTLSKSNFLIALAPYFFPFYAVLLVPIYAICVPKYQPVLALLIGFALAFHYALTLHSLRDHQSDLHETGVFFSLCFVFAMNLLVLTLFLSLIAPGVITPAAFAVETWQVMLGFLNWVAGFFGPASA